MWATPRVAEKMLDGQRQRVDIPARANYPQWPPADKAGRGFSTESSAMSPRRPIAIGRGTELN